MRKIKFVVLKETMHILRDPRSLVIAIMMPIIMTLLYGYAINLDVKNIKLAVIDFDGSSESRDLAERFYNSGYFLLAGSAPSMRDPEAVLKKGDADAVLILRPGFSEALRTGAPYEIGLLIDGADANYAAATANYSNLVVERFLQDKMPHGLNLPAMELSKRVLYNPDLKSSHFFVPGLIAVILMMISALLTSVTIAREKETGTMEQLLTTPVTPVQVIVGKVVPYVGLALLDGLLIILFAVFHFGVPFLGSAALLAFFAVIYVTAALSIGILISTVVSTQQVAMMAALLVTVLPSVMLSGFIFEIKNMPRVLQLLTNIVPAKYFLLIIRGVMLKGSGISLLWKQSIFLLLIMAVLLTLASKRFKLKIG